MVATAVAAERIVEWLAVIATPVQDIASRQPSLYASLRPALARAYRDAGSPLGENESAMLAWWQKRAEAERTRGLSRLPRTGDPRPGKRERGRAK
ncbi:MAG: hypothetical protein M1401_18355 [Chloroflexi bacterium]|nr:hypothetical protein [Chloroflexota bacterium]